MGIITKKYLEGNKREAFKLFDSLNDVEKMTYFRDLMVSDRSDVLLDVLNSFMIRYENNH